MGGLHAKCDHIALRLCNPLRHIRCHSEMTSSTVDLEAQTGVVTDPPSTNNAGAPSTDSTPNPQPPPNHNPRVTNTNDPPNEQTAKNLEVQRGILTCPIHGR